MLAFGLSAALAGLAGILLAPPGWVDLQPGVNFTIPGVAAGVLGGVGGLGVAGAVPGGLGSICGVRGGGVPVGLVQYVFGGYVLRDYNAIYPFVLMILVIAVRPQGLFARGALRRLWCGCLE